MGERLKAPLPTSKPESRTRCGHPSHPSPSSTLMKGSWSQLCLGPAGFCQLQITSDAYPIVDHPICGSASAALRFRVLILAAFDHKIARQWCVAAFLNIPGMACVQISGSFE